MFSKAFSFSGRIRRSEFGVSMIIYFVVVVIIQFILGTIGMENGGTVAEVVLPLIGLATFIPLIVFLLAQGAKRCHDLGYSGWYQLIPFFGLFMLFANSVDGPNEYGDNPKGIGNEPEFSFEKNIDPTL